MSYDPMKDADAQWEDVEVSVSPEGTSVVMSVRMSAELAARLRNEAHRLGIPTSRLVREMLEEGAVVPRLPSVAPRMSSQTAPLTFTTSMPPGQRTTGWQP